MTGFAWWWPMFSLLRIPAQWGCLLCESGTIYVVSFYLLSKYNSLINLGVGLKCLHTSVFIKTTSLEVLPTKAKEDLSPHEIRLFSTGHQSRIYYHYHHHFFFIIIIIIIIIIIKTNYLDFWMFLDLCNPVAGFLPVTWDNRKIF